MNHDVSSRVKLFSRKLDDFIISDYHGLNSPGLTCYLNSVLQVLFMTEGFRKAIKESCSESSTTIDPQLKRLFHDLEREMAKTRNIIKKLDITDVYEQRDAAEYFEKILHLTSPEVSKIFKGELNHQTTCVQCQKSNNSRSFFWILPLVVENSQHQTYSVTQGLNAFFKGEKVSEDNEMYCNQCHEKRETEIKCNIMQTPEILTLLLKRFRFDHKRKCYVKLHCKVAVSQTLHLEGCTYDLYALVNHFGNLTGGHYTAEIKSFETGQWYHFNDGIVKMVRQPQFGPGNTPVSSHTAYLLMYRNGSTNSENHEDEYAHEGRQEVAERGENDVQQLKDECCNKGKKFKHLNGDISKKVYGDTTSMEPQNVSVEIKKQLKQTVARQKPHKETSLQTNTEHLYKPSLLIQNSEFLQMQSDGHNEPNRQRLDRSKGACVPSQHFLARGTPTETWSVNVGNSYVKPFNVLSNGCSPPSSSEYNVSPSKCKKANKKMQHFATKVEATQGEKTTNVMKAKKAKNTSQGNMKKTPWR